MDLVLKPNFSALILIAAVETLKIDGNAVTLPVSAYTASSSSFGSGTWATVQSITITVPSVASAQPIILWWHGLIKQTLDAGNYGNYHIRILRDSTTIFEVTEDQLQGDSGGNVGVITDTPGTGTFTYYLQGEHNDQGSTAMLNRSLAALLAKR